VLGKDSREYKNFSHVRREASRYLKNKKREYLKDKVNEIRGTHQLLAYADDVNLLGDNIYTIKKTTETLIGARKEIGL
jgi:hypothetical protein